VRRLWVFGLLALLGCESSAGSAVDQSSGDTAGSDGGSSDDSDDPCTDVVVDGGFELGPASSAWTQGSQVFDTVICDASCVSGPATAHSGDHWVFFGGQATADSPFISQTVPIVGASATLAFFLQVDTNDQSAFNDSLTVLVDDANMLTVDNTMEPDYAGYTLVELDVSEFADNGTHLLSFDANFSGDAITSFFIDDVELQSCD